MSVDQLTGKHRKLLQHTLGARPDQNKRYHGYRNHFLASVGSDDHAEFIIMTAVGFAESGRERDGQQYFRATVEGCKAVGLSKPAIKRAFER